MSNNPPHQPTKIRQWRRKAGLSLDQLAEKAVVDKGNLSKLERGLLPYNQEVLERIAAVLGTDADSLIKRDPEQGEALWSIYDRSPPDIRAQIERLAQALVGK